MTPLERRQKAAQELEEELARRKLNREPAPIEPAEVGAWFGRHKVAWYAELAEAQRKLGPKPTKPGGAGPASFRVALDIARWEFDNTVLSCRHFADYLERCATWPEELEHLAPFLRRGVRLLEAQANRWGAKLDEKRAAVEQAQANLAKHLEPAERGKAIARGNLLTGRAKLADAIRKEVARHEEACARIAGGIASTVGTAQRRLELEQIEEDERHEEACAKFATKLDAIDRGLANVA